MFLGLFVRKLKMSDMKYALQMCEICNSLLPPYLMCHWPCCFIQLPFQTSICSPHNDIINIIFLVCVVLIIRKFFKTVIVYMSPTKQPNYLQEVSIIILHPMSDYMWAHRIKYGVFELEIVNFCICVIFW